MRNEEHRLVDDTSGRQWMHTSGRLLQVFLSCCAEPFASVRVASSSSVKTLTRNNRTRFGYGFSMLRNMDGKIWYNVDLRISGSRES